MPWFKKSARKVWRATPASKWKRSPWRKRQARRYRRYNKKYKGVGYTPDYALSPIDAIPYAGRANKSFKASKASQRAAKNTIRVTKAGYRYTKSRGRRKTSSPNRRRKPRGTYYYYRGKRYYRK